MRRNTRYKRESLRRRSERERRRRNWGYRWTRWTGGRRRCGRDGWTQAPAPGGQAGPGSGRKAVCLAIFDCFDRTVLSLVMDDNMRAELCVWTLDGAAAAYPGLRGAIIHSDRGSQYTSGAYRAAVESMASAKAWTAAAVRACGPGWRADPSMTASDRRP